MVPIPAAIMKAMGRFEIKTMMIYVSLGESHIREQIEKLNSIIVPESACSLPTSGAREHAYLPRASRMQRTQGV